jgi:hypothetical protein
MVKCISWLLIIGRQANRTVKQLMMKALYKLISIFVRIIISFIIYLDS